VETTSEYGLALDQFNHVVFKPVTTEAIKLEINLQKDKSAGVSEWKVQ
jgi:hypothetical protein